MSNTLLDTTDPRADLYKANEERITQLVERAIDLRDTDHIRRVVVVIDPDAWPSLTLMLMGDVDWNVLREGGRQPVARGLIPISLAEIIVKSLKIPGGHTKGDMSLDCEGIPVLVFAASGVTCIEYGDTLSFSTRSHKKVQIELGSYEVNGRLSVMLTQGTELLAVLSVNLEDAPEPAANQFWAKTWSENAELAAEALKSGFFADTGARHKTGFVEAQLWEVLTHKISDAENCNWDACAGQSLP